MSENMLIALTHFLMRSELGEFERFAGLLISTLKIEYIFDNMSSNFN